VGVKLYDGDFSPEVDDIEDIVALHLAAAQSDIVLLLGFDWVMPKDVTDRLVRHKLTNRHGLMRGVIDGSPNVQWVAVDSEEMDKSYRSLPNLTSDSLRNVLQLLI